MSYLASQFHKVKSIAMWFNLVFYTIRQFFPKEIINYPNPLHFYMEKLFDCTFLQITRQHLIIQHTLSVNMHVKMFFLVLDFYRYHYDFNAFAGNKSSFQSCLPNFNSRAITSKEISLLHRFWDKINIAIHCRLRLH